MRPARLFPTLCLLLLALLLASCSSHMTASQGEKPYVTMPTLTADSDLVKRYAPAYLIHNPQDEHNLIGRPKARLRGDNGSEEIYVDPAESLIYYESIRFWTQKGWYQNLIYRVHFKGTPLSLIPFYIGYGHNNGLMVVVTLDQHDLPVLISTVGTCGCYISFTSTTYTPLDMMPEDWLAKTHNHIYGEEIPTQLDFDGHVMPRLLVTVGPGEHRVMNLEVLDGATFQGDAPYQLAKAELTPMQDLKNLTLGEGTTSFYSTSTRSIGHVKGAFKPLEFITLGLWAMDPRVGQDKEYGNIRNPFYTSLRPWNRMASDMNDFPRFLRFYGWKP